MSNVINDNLDISEKSIDAMIDEIIINLQAAKELGTEFMYQTLMDYGKKLGKFPKELMTDENKIHGCQSTVYIAGKNVNSYVFFQGFADSKLVQGQVAILLKIFDGQKGDDIINSGDKLNQLVESTDIIASLTPSRQNAFGSMFEHIKIIAKDSCVA